MNSIVVDPTESAVRISAGAGFDSDYELNFRARSARQVCGWFLRKLFGREPTERFSAAFDRVWRGKSPVSLETAESVLGRPLTPQKILAAHYAGLLLPHLPARDRIAYLEIGPGSGYLAAIIHHLRPGPLVLIDLPDMLPFSFLTLHRTFPSEPFILPNEAGGVAEAIATNHLVFLTSALVRTVPNASIDLSVNTASFGEMLPDQIRAYFTLLRRVSKPSALFFTMNREEKWMTGPGTPKQGIPIRFDDYPWSKEDENLFLSVSEFHTIVQPENRMRTRLCRLARQPFISPVR
jgi:hypothetical protein